MSNPVEIVLIYQSLLGIYGDRGNAMVLLKRLQWRGIETKLSDFRGRKVLLYFYSRAGTSG